MLAVSDRKLEGRDLDMHILDGEEGLLVLGGSRRDVNCNSEAVPTKQDIC